VELGRFRVGLRVGDVESAARFYRGLGFEDVGSVPDPEGNPVMVMLQREGVMLIVDALEGMPFPDTEREARVKAGPRGNRSKPSACTRRSTLSATSGSTRSAESLSCPCSRWAHPPRQ
jgi:hypothetical protein